MANFALWQRENLEKIAYELVEESRQLRADNKMLLEQWRKVLTEKCQDEVPAGSPDPRWPSQ